MKKSVFSANNISRIATWNVRTLYQSGQLAQLMKEFDRYQLDVLGIGEVRWTGSGQLVSDGKVLLYSGRDEHHYRGVGLVLSKRTAEALIGWQPVSDRIISGRFYSTHAKTTIVQVYAPNEDADDVEKDAFYEQLQDVFDAIPNHDLKILMGDFNAQLCSKQLGFDKVMGPFASSERTSQNGERFLSFCDHNDLCIGNTYFQHRRIHKKTWRSPGGQVFNEIDYICISRKWRSALRDARAYRDADIGSDHYLVRACLQLKLRSQKFKPKPIQPFAVENLKNEIIANTFKIDLHNRFEVLKTLPMVEDQWRSFKEVITTSAQNIIGRRRGRPNERWIKNKTWALIEERRAVKQRREQAQTESVLKEASEAYTKLNRQVKRSCRQDKKDWLEQKSAEAQEAANRNDTKTLYRIVNDLVGKRRSTNLPIKDKHGKMLLTEKEQNARWVEHFREMLNQPDPPSLYDFDTIPSKDMLAVNLKEITAQEVASAVKILRNGKAAGLDEISAELLKFGGSAIIEKLTDLFNTCWQLRKVPEDWQKGAIVKLPKKGNLAECTNWRGITLLSVPGKVFCTILLQRLRAAVDKQLREEQAGFRCGRSCSEQIFVLRNIVEQCVEYKHPLSINFVDFQKAFDSVHRESLWRILLVYGIPQQFIDIIKNLYVQSSCCVKTGTEHTPFFNIVTGVRQGCVLSPFLFLVTIDFIMRETMTQSDIGINWTDQTCLSDLDFADDIALLEENDEKLQGTTTRLVQEASKVGLRISADKSKIMHICPTNDTAKVLVGQRHLEEVTNFTYLGSIIGQDGDAEMDVKNRIGKAMAVFQRMRPIWSSSAISLNIKLNLYASIVIPMAIYASETWKMTARIIQKINAFHHRCLRRILHISYLDHVTNKEVLHRSSSISLENIVAQRRIRLAGHVLRMPQYRLPRVAIQWTPPASKRNRGRPRNTWRRTFDEDLRRLNISWVEAETMAEDRRHWRALVARYATQRGTD